MTPLFLADLPTPTSSQFGVWCACALMVSIVILQLLDYFRKARTEIHGEKHVISPQPLEIRTAQSFATKEEVDQLRRRVESVAVRIDDRFEELDRKRSTSIAGLHKAIDEKTYELRSEMKRDTEGLHERITDVLAGFSELKGQVQAHLNQ